MGDETGSDGANPPANISGVGDLVGQDEVIEDKTGSNGSRKGVEVSLDSGGSNEAEDVSMDASRNIEDVPMHDTEANPTSGNTLVREDLRKALQLQCRVISKWKIL
jgi:hypothetical protein